MPPTEHDDAWAARQAEWQRHLPRLMLGAEPVEDQLARYRRVTWTLTILPLGMGLIIFGIFLAFEAPGVGATVAGILLLPIVAFAWLDDWRLRRKALAYLRERSEYEYARRLRSGASADTDR